MRGRRDINSTSSGVPMASANAYRLTSEPADSMEICKSFAMVGRMPTTMNSVTPMAKAPTASASTPGGILLV